MKLVDLGIDDEEAVSFVMEQLPSLKEGPAQPHRDTDLKEFTPMSSSPRDQCMVHGNKH